MTKEKLIGEEKINALRRIMTIPGTRIGTQNRGSKTYKTIEAEPGVLNYEEERAVRILYNEVRIQRWGAENQNFYIFFEE